jgi:hypothetical protein
MSQIKAETAVAVLLVEERKRMACNVFHEEYGIIVHVWTAVIEKQYYTT